MLHLASHQPEHHRDAFSVAPPEFLSQKPPATPFEPQLCCDVWKFPAIKRENAHVKTPAGPITVRKGRSQFKWRFTAVHCGNQKTLFAKMMSDYFVLWGFSRHERWKVLSGFPQQGTDADSEEICVCWQISTLRAPRSSLRSCKRELSEDPRVFSKYFTTKNEFALKLYLSPIKKKP